MVQFASYVRRVLHKTRFIFSRMNVPIVVEGKKRKEKKRKRKKRKRKKKNWTFNILSVVLYLFSV